MNTAWIITTVACGTFLVTLCTALLISGMRFGGLVSRVETLEKALPSLTNLQTDVRLVQHDISEIKGMFKLTLKKPDG